MAKIFLLDGPLMLAPERAAALTRAMAADLVAGGLPDSDQDATRALLKCGYPTIDVDLLGTRALDEARRMTVAAVMAEARS